MSCSGCGGSGHNIRTCSSNYVSYNPSSSRKDFDYDGGNSRSYVRQHACSGCGKSGHNIRTCSGNLKNDNPSSSNNKDNIISAAKTKNERACSGCGKVGHNIRTCTSSNYVKKEQKKLVDLDDLHAQLKKVEIEGLARKEGEGYIYMYKDASGKHPNWVKIGMSKYLPQRRVRQQEQANGENYQLICSMETPYHKLAENIVHRQLNAFRKEKSEGDGKTEWFWGDPKMFEEVIRYVITELKHWNPEFDTNVDAGGGVIEKLGFTKNSDSEKIWRLIRKMIQPSF